jgi:hypothetical protein
MPKFPPARGSELRHTQSGEYHQFHHVIFTPVYGAAGVLNELACWVEDLRSFVGRYISMHGESSVR